VGEEAIIEFHLKNPLEGYRRLTFMMLDADVVAVSPASVLARVEAGWIVIALEETTVTQGGRFRPNHCSRISTGISTFPTSTCAAPSITCASILDGFSRFLVHWDLRESMRESDVELILQRAKEKYPEARPRIISDNGPQFIARDFKEFIRISGMTHVRTSPYYPQSNGKIERWHKSLKSECIRRERRCRWKMRGVWSRATWSITTTSA